MRSAGNFHPEWGYLAPAPSFMRSVRIALVATVIGATAGAAVVVSLVDRPGATEDNSSIAAHALVTSTAPVVTAPTVAALPLGQAAATAVAQVAAAAKPQPTLQAKQASAAPQKSKPGLQATSTPAISASAVPEEPKPGVPADSTPLAAASTSKADTGPAAATPPPPSARETVLRDRAPPAEAAPVIATDTAAPSSAIKRRRAESYLARRRWQAANANKKQWHNDSHGFAALFRLFSAPFDN